MSEVPLSAEKGLPPHEDWCCAKGCADYGFCEGCGGTEDDCRCVVREVRHYSAQAWDEGYDARGVDIANEGLTYTTLTPNPYRVTPPGEQS